MSFHLCYFHNEKNQLVQGTCLGIKQTSSANMVLICFQSTGKLFSLKRGWVRVEAGALVSEKERKKFNKYFAEGELRGPDANPEQITGKQKQLVGEYHCSKHTTSSPVCQRSSSPSFTVSKHLGKKQLECVALIQEKQEEIQFILGHKLKSTLGFPCQASLCALHSMISQFA